MAEGTKVRNWSYPFPVKSAADMSSTSTNESQIYQAALAKAKSGHYPIGRNGLWHGGIHFDEGTAELLDQTSVRCIADGEVIAYRVDGKESDSYPEANFSTGKKKYSTGFVLVRHSLEVPRPPLATGATAAGPASEAQPKLTFYSLYMHLLDWASYNREGGPALPPFLGKTVYNVKPEKAVDPVLGLRVRAGAGSGFDIKALLPKGTRVRLGEKTAATGEWCKLLSILEGNALPSLDLDEDCWVYSKELESTSREDEFLVGEHANDKETDLAPSKGLNVRKTGNGRSDDPKTGLIPVGATFTLKPGSGDYRELEGFISGQDLSPLSPTTVKNISGFVYLPYLQTSRIKPDLGEVLVLRTPYRINAGEIVGHPGCYQNHDDATASPMVHLEVFCCEDPSEFIARSRSSALGFPEEQKTLLKIHKGDSKLITHRPDISASNPPKLTDEGIEIGVDLTLSQNLLDGLPAERKIIVSETPPGSTTPKDTYWWHLDGLFGDASGNLIGGWLCEQPGITTRHSPWEWEGFEIISEGACNADFLACHLDATETLEESERTDYAARIDLADNGPVRSRLYEIIDGADGTTRDGKLTPEEIKSALAKPWHAQSISRLITHYESEWHADEGFSKWEALNCYMTREGETDWRQEKERIKSLLWLPDLMRSGLSALTEHTWQLHPITAVTYFSNSCIPLVRAQEIALLVSSGYEGKAELDFEALAGNFDGQGMSFGIIQWNFGQGTLGPVLKEMRDTDTSVFDACFGENMNLNTLVSALNSGNQTNQFNWSTGVQLTNQTGWKQAFKNIGQIEKFKSIQLKHAAKYHENVLKCINLMREIAPHHMTNIELRTYVALYDLCVQQNNLNRAKQEIIDNYSPSDIENQRDLLIYVCKKRAERAASVWVSDCLSRRMGIIQGSTYTATANDLTSSRANPNFGKIITGVVCEI